MNWLGRRGALAGWSVCWLPILIFFQLVFLLIFASRRPCYSAFFFSAKNMGFSKHGIIVSRLLVG